MNMHVYPDLRLYIAGEWRKKSGGDQPVLNPADEDVIGAVPMAARSDLDDALASAVEGFRVWSRTAPRERARVLMKAAQLIRERIVEIALSITLEHGKPFAASQAEVIRGCEFFEMGCRRGPAHLWPGHPQRTGHPLYHHPPAGGHGRRLLAVELPDDPTVAQDCRRAGCRLLDHHQGDRGNPRRPVHIARALDDAGLPRGAFNLVFGVPSEVSNYLIPKEQTRLIAFTGSTAVGKHLTEMAARHMKPVLMELGGHAPVIVCDDVDPVAAANISALRKARNSGQVCTSPTRFYVHKSQYNAFSKAFAEKARSVVVGNGLDLETEMGPVANHRRIEALRALTEDAVAKGAKLLAGGETPFNRGYFFPVTVLAELPDDARVMREEPFGPLAVINPVSSLDEAIEKANSLPFGLASSYAFTHSAANADRLSAELEAGTVSINTLEASVAEVPFGGVKDSDYGREGGAEGPSHYTHVKTVSHRMALA